MIEAVAVILTERFKKLCVVLILEKTFEKAFARTDKKIEEAFVTVFTSFDGSCK